MQVDQLKNSQYCHQKAAPSGSSIYYSLLGENTEKKEQLISLHAFHNELRELISTCSDPGLARIKLAWWGEEIERMQNHQPRHPVTQSLLYLSLNKNYQIFSRLVEHYEIHLGYQQPENYQDLMTFLQQGPGIFWQHLAVISGYQDSNTPMLVSKMGALFAYFDLLQELPLHTRQQRIYYPSSNGQDQTDSKTIIQKQLQNIADDLDTLVKQQPPVDYKNQRHALILAHIILETCREIHRSDSDPLLGRISLTPIRKLWIAWKNKIKYQ